MTGWEAREARLLARAYEAPADDDPRLVSADAARGRVWQPVPRLRASSTFGASTR